MDERLIRELNRTLALMLRVSVLQLVHGKTRTEQVLLLSVAGFQPKEIAGLLGTTPNTVRVALSGLRKRRKLRRAAGSTQPQNLNGK